MATKFWKENLVLCLSSPHGSPGHFKEEKEYFPESAAEDKQKSAGHHQITVVIGQGVMSSNWKRRNLHGIWKKLYCEGDEALAQFS